MTADWRLFGVSFTVGLAATWAVAAVARRKGLLDLPEERRTHTMPTPRLGGVGILLGLAAGWIAVCWLSPWETIYRADGWGRTQEWKIQAPLVAGATAFFLVGLVDDLRRNRRGGLPAWAKFLLQAGAASVPVLLGMEWFGWTVTFETELFESWPPVLLGGGTPYMTALWFIAVVNVVNFMDGIDAIAASIVIPILFAATWWGSGFTHIPWCTSAAAIGFLVWNRPPARIFMGDGGSHLLGFLVAAQVCRVPWFRVPGTTSQDQWYFTAAPWPLVAAPLVPSIVDVAEALIHKARHGIPMSLAHNDHLYQRLVKAGVPTGLVALRYGLLSVAAILCAGPLAHAIGVLPASAVGFAILALHWVDGVRRTRGVSRLTAP